MCASQRRAAALRRVRALEVAICDIKLGRSAQTTFAFTEHGAIMAAAVLNSPRAIEMSVYVVRAFVQLRALATSHHELARRLAELEQRIARKLTAHPNILSAIATDLGLR